MPRHILVFGSTSPAGQDFCLRALRDSHTPTLYVRSPSELPVEISVEATIIAGNLEEPESLEAAISCGAKTCVSFLGPVLGGGTKGAKPITDGYKITVPLLQNHKYERVLVVGTASYKVSEDTFSLFYRLMVWSVYLLFRVVYDEITGFTPVITSMQADEVKWTVFRPPMLRNGEAKEVKAGYMGDVGLVLERKGLAEWVLREMKGEKWLGKCPAVANA